MEGICTLASFSPLMARAVPALENRLKGARIKWFENLPVVLAMLVGGLKINEKFPTLLRERLRPSVLR